MQRAVRARVLQLFVRLGLIRPEAAAEMRQWAFGAPRMQVVPLRYAGPGEPMRLIA